MLSPVIHDSINDASGGVQGDGRQKTQVSYRSPGAVPPIYIAGSMNSPPWTPIEMSHEPDPNSGSPDALHFFHDFYDIPEGLYSYKFRLGAEGDWWVHDSSAPIVVDAVGNTNNQLVIKKPSLSGTRLQSGADQSRTQSPSSSATNPETLDGRQLQTKGVAVSNKVNDLPVPHIGGSSEAFPKCETIMGAKLQLGIAPISIPASELVGSSETKAKITQPLDKSYNTGIVDTHQDPRKLSEATPKSMTLESVGRHDIKQPTISVSTIDEADACLKKSNAEPQGLQTINEEVNGSISDTQSISTTVISTTNSDTSSSTFGLGSKRFMLRQMWEMVLRLLIPMGNALTGLLDWRRRGSA